MLTDDGELGHGDGISGSKGDFLLWQEWRLSEDESIRAAIGPNGPEVAGLYLHSVDIPGCLCSWNRLSELHAKLHPVTHRSHLVLQSLCHIQLPACCEKKSKSCSVQVDNATFIFIYFYSIQFYNDLNPNSVKKEERFIFPGDAAM